MAWDTTPRPLMVALAVTSAMSFLSYVSVWLLRKPKKEKPRYGRKIRDEAFLLGDDVTNCNHGSYGTVPKQVLKARGVFLKEAEYSPDIFMRLKSNFYYEKALLRVAEFVGANIEHLVFVENTTAEMFVIRLVLKLPINNKEEIIQQYIDVLENNPSVKVAVIDHITSSSAMVMPIKELIVVCQSRGVQVVIDGAHAPGQLQLNLEKLGADYYIGNLHKWVFAVRGSALLWIHPKHCESIKPLITSLCYRQSLFDQFSSQGTRDSTPYFCAPAAIQFYEDIGGFEEIAKYNTELLLWAMELLKESWKTESLPIPDSMRAPFMGIVALPDTSKGPIMNTNDKNIPQLVQRIYEKYRIYVMIVYHQERLWCRLSAQVHNTRNDYIKLRDAVIDML
ncbi:uncharacterized protein LOC144355796 [Saccoglossus kowalevskii]